jgi:hypothetical protein
MHFEMIIHIYNQKGASKNHYFKNISTTNVGIYSIPFQSKEIAVKCFPIS